jgi:phage-related protein
MAIVGTAYVRLRVIGDKLKKDISDSVKNSIDASSADLKHSGEQVGEKITQGVEEKVTKEASKTGARVADDLGNAIGSEMGKRFNSSIGVKMLSAFDGMWTKLKRGASTGVRDVGKVFDGIKGIFVREEGDTRSFGGRLLGAFGSVFSGLWNATKAGFSKIGTGFGAIKGFFQRAQQDAQSGADNVAGRLGAGGKKISGALTAFKADFKKITKGLGFSDFLVPLIGALVTALPSALSFAGAIIGSFAGFAVVALSALGPAIAGGALAGVAALGTLKLSMGLIGLAMKQQTPALDDFKKRLDAFKTTIAKPIQEGMLSGFNAAMRIAQPLIKSLNPMLREFGFNVGDIAINISRMLASADNMNRLQRILTVNNDAVKGFGAGIQGLVQAFLVLFDHLSPVIEYLASGAKQLGEWASSSILAAEASGKLDSFITKMFSSFTQLIGIVVDFGKGIINVFHAAFGASGGMLTNLQGIAAKFKEWTGSDAGQAKMLDFFTKARIVTDQVLEILGKITKAAGSGLGGMNVDSILSGLKTLESLGAPIAKMFNTIKEASGGAWQKTFENFAKVVTQLANDGVFGILAKALSNFFEILSAILAIPGVSKLVGLAASMLVLAKTFSLVSTVAKILFSGLKLLFGIIAGIAEVLGWPITIALALTAALIWFFTQTKIGRAIVEAVWNAIKTAISAAGKAIMVAFDAVVSALKAAWKWIVKVAGDIWSAISDAFHKVWSVVSTVANAVWGVIKTVFTAIFNFYVTIWTAIFNVVKTVLTAVWDVFKVIFNAVKTVVETVLNIIWQIWIRIFPILLLPLRVFEGIVILVWRGLVDAISWAINLIWTVLTTVWNAIWGFLQPIIQGIWDFIVGAWNAISNAISAAISFIWNIIVTVWTAVWGFLQPIIQGIWDFIVGAWTAISNAINAAIQFVWNIIVTVWNAIWGFISGVISGIGNAVAAGWNWIVGAIQGALNGAWSFIQFIWNKITGFVSGALDFLKGLVKGAWDVLGNIGGGILDGLKHAVNAVIDGVNWVIGGLNGAIHLANKLPGVDIPDIPKIPHLAKGGVVSPTGGGTLAMIAEAGRPERVEPLDENGLSKRDHAILKLIGDGAGGGTDVRVFIGDTELTHIVRTEVDKKNKNLASSLATGRKG